MDKRNQFVIQIETASLKMYFKNPLVLIYSQTHKYMPSNKMGQNIKKCFVTPC